MGGKGSPFAQIDPASGDYEPAFEAADYPGNISLRGRSMWDTPVYNNFGGSGRGTTGPSNQGSVYSTPVRELVATNEPLVPFATTENITRWSPWLGGGNTRFDGSDAQAVAQEPLHVSSHNMVGTGNFFASDPSLWGASLSMQTSWEHMALGGSVMLGHQTYSRTPVQSQFSPEFYPSTVYEPAPSFGSVVPRVV